MDGILPLWKPKGFTSHDCVSKARGMMKTRKIGHTGTLDPDVEGVLPLCVGKATKIVPFLTDTEKVYEGTVTLGYSTDTEDASGETIESKAVDPSLTVKEIENALLSFQGNITQTPPMYSAVKVNGKKLYEYAREGIEVERPTRTVTIEEISLLNKDLVIDGDTVSFGIRVVCSKGTYIRTLCVDIGKALGYPAHMASLVRTKTADITAADCYTFTQVQEAADQDQRDSVLLPLARGLTHMPSWDISDEYVSWIQHGRVLEKPNDLDADTFNVKHGEDVLAIYQQHPSKPGLIKPVRVF
ncbi:tRNA pseudouridine(55) synthase TruB [Halobacillus locisalis]|uniref:tRNA pseudouridine synthase B n=1 Tax=Halobacillus locisalis TaxID=220753 RepID=A0A838CQM9_9BACI|nr:tRNA pseudouridine(55) synthase TruB [Halobacillus locisalis]MBA2174065.1 tRNA pseudouridine(55) synthase TruB [Halobacillus locisalis]